MILLTGANGFVGSHILEELVSRKNGDVVITKRSSHSDLSKIAHIDPTAYRIYDLSAGTIEDLFEKHRIEMIVNAAVAYGREGVASSINVLESNLIFPIRLIEEGLKRGLKSFINTDSYFNKNNYTYTHLLNYAISKKSLLLWLKNFSARIKVVNMMLEHVYGLRDSPDKFVMRLFDDIVNNHIPEVNLTYGHQIRDFVYVKDVSKAYVHVIDAVNAQEFGFREYYVGAGVGRSVRDFALALKTISNSETRLNFGALPYRSDEIMSSVADIRELRNIGWSPQYDVEKGLKDMLSTEKRYSID